VVATQGVSAEVSNVIWKNQGKKRKKGGKKEEKKTV